MKKNDLIGVHRIRGKSLTGKYAGISCDPYQNYREYLIFECDDYQNKKIQIPLSNVSVIEVLGREK